MDNGKNEVFLWVAECWKANVGTQKGKGLKIECKSLCVFFFWDWGGWGWVEVGCVGNEALDMFQFSNTLIYVLIFHQTIEIVSLFPVLYEIPLG